MINIVVLRDVTGVIIQAEEVRVRGTAPRAGNQPYRCIFSNLAGRTLRLLIWGRRIPEFQGRLAQQVCVKSAPSTRQ